MNIKDTFKIEHTFLITGRGTVVVIGEKTERHSANPYAVEISASGYSSFTTIAYPEFFTHNSKEKEAYCLTEIHKNEIPENASITFLNEVKI